MLGLFESRPQKWFWLFGSFVASIIATVVLVNLLRKRQVRKGEIVNTVIICLIFYTLGIYADWTSLLFHEIYAIELPIWGSFVGLATDVSFTCTALGNIFLLRFIQLIFFEKEKPKLHWVLYTLEILVIPVFWIDTVIDNNDLETIALGVHALASLIIYISLYLKSVELRKKLKLTSSTTSFESASINFIGIAGLFLATTIIMFILKEVVDWSEGGYWTLMIGWLCAGISAFFLYIGFIVPEWFKKRYS
jgi:hypothetical protein